MSGTISSIGLLWIVMWTFPALFYQAGYRAGLDGSTLDPAGTWCLIFLAITVAIFLVGLGARLAGK